MAANLMPITGQVLDDALRSRGISRQEAAEASGVSTADVDAWIQEKRSPNMGQFRALVRLLGCTPSYLFLPTPPERSSTSVAFRTFPESPVDAIPAETAAAIDLARKVQSVASWIAQQIEDEDARPVPSATTNDNPEEVGSRLRRWLGWSTEDQTSSDATDASAGKGMRAAIQRAGVTVLHLTMDGGVTRGFSLNGRAPVIAVNTRDHIRARLFSYAHELAHLALHDEAVCLTHNDRGVERFCNRVAAAILMPETTFRRAVERKVAGRVENRENVVTIRNHFKVSMQAAAIRAEALGLAPENLYGDIEYDPEAKGRGGTYIPGNERTRPRVRVDQYGFGFVNALLDAEDAGALKRNQVLDILRLSDNELETARSLAMTGATE